MKPLYSPPNGTFPQEVPAYYRENNNSVRTDLPEFSHEELIAFGFSGPYTIPVPSYTDEDGNLVEGDYDLETQYWEWNETRRNFIIKNKENEEKTVLPLPEPPPTEDLKVSKQEFLSYAPLYEIKETADWKGFKQEFLSYEPLNTIIANAISVIPIAALSFPTTFLECEKGNYSDFTDCWNTIKTTMKVSTTIITHIKERCEFYHLPVEFINII